MPYFCSADNCQAEDDDLNENQAAQPEDGSHLSEEEEDEVEESQEMAEEEGVL